MSIIGNKSAAILLISKNCRAILGTYEAEPNAKEETFKTFDADIQIGDLVVVPSTTRHRVTIVKITAVDVRVNYESTQEIRWVIGKVDLAKHDLVISREKEMLDKIDRADEHEREERLREQLLKHAGAEIMQTEIVAIGDDRRDKK